MEEMAKTAPHPNDEFFKKDIDKFISALLPSKAVPQFIFDKAPTSHSTTDAVTAREFPQFTPSRARQLRRWRG
ncbi:MAG: hypothetical protein HZT40_07560 [Candidatus Thiothrix singaporensis]|nr:MAG: hypothetical protein HZT40_07560 [Candidatus Thiothrix singaporensis]